MELLLAALFIATAASLAVLMAGVALATYRGRRSRRRFVPPGGDSGA